MSQASGTNEPALSKEQSKHIRALAQSGDKDAERVLALAKAADQENARAQFYLAHSLQEGALGLPRDAERARKLFARAAKNGYPEAQQELDRQNNASTSSRFRKDASVSVNLPPLTTKQQKLVRFDDAIIRLAVRAYILSIPIFFKENDLIPLMTANKAHFAEDGMVILYLKTAGSAMAQGAMAFHGTSSAQGLFGGISPDMQRLAAQADAQMRSQGVALGQDFLWLAQVLPPAAMGDYAPFQAQSQFSPLRQQMLVAVQMFKMAPQMAQPIIAQMQQMLPIWEQEVYDNVARLDISLPAEYGHTEAHSKPVRMPVESDGSAERKLGHQENTSPGSHSQSEAVYQCRDAAEQGNAIAQNNLGVMYEQGQGVAQDVTKAADLYRKAADQGLAIAQNNLGTLYEQGRGVAQNYAEALKLYRKAADQGLALAQCNLGTLYAQGQGVAQNYAEALKLYRKAADQGLALAQNNLGVMYEQGQVVGPDDTKAADLYRKAADQGLALAQCNLGVLHLNGRGVAQDDTKAVDLLRKAAEQGLALAQNNLAVMYHEGRGVKQDMAKAVEWCRKAAEQGNIESQKALKALAQIVGK